MIIPSGLSSEAKLKNAKFCVQTEFAQRPKPRVTTTISRDGVVVEKVENVWEGLPQNEEEKEKIERFLRRQHQEVLAKITRGMDESAALPGEADQIASPDRTVIGRIDQELSGIDGVLGWVHVSGDERVTSHHLSPPETRGISDLVDPLKDISSLLASVSGLGSLVGGILESPRSSELCMPFGAHFLVVKVDFGVDLKDLAKRIRSVV
ncbi:MAG: hypothetical protein JSV10_10995 [Candidatus Zixiibacteriota bacterium]|nr:MAG: hypothetical protein JSV10_10995 [candidate division Zixibacteria bacterium]